MEVYMDCIGACTRALGVTKLDDLIYRESHSSRIVTVRHPVLCLHIFNQGSE